MKFMHKSSVMSPSDEVFYKRRLTIWGAQSPMSAILLFQWRRSTFRRPRRKAFPYASWTYLYSTTSGPRALACKLSISPALSLSRIRVFSNYSWNYWLKGFEHIELPAKLLDYFLRGSRRNINQYDTYFIADVHGRTYAYGQQRRLPTRQ